MEFFAHCFHHFEKQLFTRAMAGVKGYVIFVQHFREFPHKCLVFRSVPSAHKIDSCFFQLLSYRFNFFFGFVKQMESADHVCQHAVAVTEFLRVEIQNIDDPFVGTSGHKGTTVIIRYYQILLVFVGVPFDKI